MVKFIINFISNEGFFEKCTVFKKTSQNGRKIPKWVTLLAFFQATLVINAVFNLNGSKVQQVISNTSDLF